MQENKLRITKTQFQDIESVEKALEEQIKNQEVPQVLTGSAKKRLETYKRTPRFSRLYNQAVDFFSQARLSHEEEVVDFRTLFVGKVFEDLSYNLIVKNCPEDHLVLSPGHTQALFEDFFKNRERILDPFGHRGIEGTGVPDVLVINNIDNDLTITRWCEFSISVRNDYFRKKWEGFDRFYKKNERFSNLLKDTQLTFVTPYNKVNPEVVSNGLAELFNYPIFTGELFKFFEDIFNHYRPNESNKTLSDIWSITQSQKR